MKIATSSQARPVTRTPYGGVAMFYSNGCASVVVVAIALGSAHVAVISAAACIGGYLRRLLPAQVPVSSRMPRFDLCGSLRLLLNQSMDSSSIRIAPPHCPRLYAHLCLLQRSLPVS
jgi:hypothetical protein